MSLYIQMTLRRVHLLQKKGCIIILLLSDSQILFLF